MKTLLLTLATVAALASAQADTFADTDNQGGGKITILHDACEGKPTSRAYFYTKDGQTEDGCWRYDGDTIVIEWEKQGKRRYPIKYFTLRGPYRDFKSF